MKKSTAYVIAAVLAAGINLSAQAAGLGVGLDTGGQVGVSALGSSVQVGAQVESEASGHSRITDERKGAAVRAQERMNMQGRIHEQASKTKEAGMQATSAIGATRNAGANAATKGAAKVVHSGTPAVPSNTSAHASANATVGTSQ